MIAFEKKNLQLIVFCLISPQVFLDKDASLQQFEKAFNSLGLKPLEIDADLEDVISDVKVVSQKKVGATIKTANGTINVSITKAKELNYQVNCSRDGLVDEAVFEGENEKTISGSCGSKQLDIHRISKFSGSVKVVHISNQKVYEIGRIASHYNLTKQYKLLKSETNYGKLASLSIVVVSISSNITLVKDKKTHLISEQLTMPMLISSVAKIDTRIDGLMVKAVKASGDKPHVITNYFITNIVV